MHYYQFNIGDYAKKTQHLTNDEDLAYRRALDLYYDTENPLVLNNIPLLARRLRVNQKALENVLAEFFPEGKNKHADEEIAAYHSFLAKQSRNGKLGGRPKKTQAFPTDNPSQTQKKPNQQPLTNNHKPITNNKTPIAPLEIPGWLRHETWEEFCQHRGRGFSQLAKKKVINELDRLRQNGHDPTEVINQSIANGWKGVFEIKRNGSNAVLNDERKRVYESLTGRTQSTERDITGECITVEVDRPPF